MSKSKSLRGFSLVELSVVLVIVSILVGAGFSGLGAFLDNAHQSHTQGNLEVTKRSVLNFVKINHYMPCPDTDADGVENRVAGMTCVADDNGNVTGTIPYQSLGLEKATASDDYANVFRYGVNVNASSAVEIINPCDSASYFAKNGDSYVDTINCSGSSKGTVAAPVFTLDTPPTTATTTTVAESYVVCAKDSADCNPADASFEEQIEVEAIPAVIVAFNENGQSTNLGACGASESGREAENCDTDRLLWRGIFSEGVFDDQMVTISGYEIKQQVLDLLNGVNFDDSGDSDPTNWEEYDIIIRGDLDSSNDLNVSNSTHNRYFIDDNGTGSSVATEDGDFNASVVFKDGNDVLYVSGDIEAGGNAQMKKGDDEVFVGGNVEDGGVINLGDSTSVDDPLALDDDLTDKDKLTVAGVILQGGSVIGDRGSDIVTLNTGVYGSVDMGADNDFLIINKGSDGSDIVIGESANIDGGSGDDVLYVEMDKTTWDALWTERSSNISNFEFLSLEGQDSLLHFNGSVFE